LLDGLHQAQYSFCVIDPDGFHEAYPGAVLLGSSERPPSVHEILKLFADPEHSGVINLSGLPPQRRQTFFHELMPHLSELRTRSGLPHWLVIDSEQIPAEIEGTASVLQI